MSLPAQLELGRLRGSPRSQATPQVRVSSARIAPSVSVNSRLESAWLHRLCHGTAQATYIRVRIRRPSNDASTGRAATIPVNPAVKADQGIDATVHDFLKSWVVDRQPQNAIAYISPISYPCLETIAARKQKPIPPGMARFNTLVAMDKFNTSLGKTTSVEDVFEAATNWKPDLKEQKNTYPAEFRLVEMPADMALDDECVQSPGESAKKEKGEFYGAAVRGKLGDGRNKVMSMLWTKEGKY